MRIFSNKSIIFELKKVITVLLAVNEIINLVYGVKYKNSLVLEHATSAILIISFVGFHFLIFY